MQKLLQEKLELEALVASMLINGQPYTAHMLELLDLNKEIARLANVH